MFKLFEEVDGGFGAHALDARDVVGAVAGEGLEIHHLLRRDAELGDHALAADLAGATVFGVGAATHVEHGDVALVVDQLEQVAVAGEDSHPPAGVGCPVGQGAEHVIGLEARRHRQGDVEALGEDLLQVGQVGEKVLRRHIPVGLIGRICLVAEGGLGSVESHH